MQWLRFSQLGEVLEWARIEDVLRALSSSPSHLEYASIEAVIESECKPLGADATELMNFERTVAAFPDVALKRAAQQVQGGDRRDLLNGVSNARSRWRWQLQHALKVSEARRTKELERLMSTSVRERPRWKVIELDMGVSN